MKPLSSEIRQIVSMTMWQQEGVPLDEEYLETAVEAILAAVQARVPEKITADIETIPTELTEGAMSVAVVAVRAHGFNNCVDQVLEVLE